MNKLVIAVAAVSLLIAGCSKPDETAGPKDGATNTSGTGGASTAKPEEAVAGTWKIDMDKSVLTGMTDKEKAEGASIVVEIKADGTFSSKTGEKEAKTGTWALKDKKVTFTGDSGIPPEWTLADDSKTMSVSMDEGGKKVTIVMSKG